ncbi:MAG TPA: DNA repair protein RecO [Thermopetrobacter sp.]|nr:DNA repair protein RecO [Thermopetrobacter sp.]
MEWTDEAIILGLRPHGESGGILEVFTRRHGRWRAHVRGAASRRLRPLLQPGRLVQATWRARLTEQLGHMRVEPLDAGPAHLLADPLSLSGLVLLCFDLHLAEEREALPALHDAARVVLAHLHDPATFPALLARLELRLLADLGFGLDLAACAAGGEGPLVWVSPKSGRAVSASAGRPWADRLLPLPAFLRDAAAPPPDAAAMADALVLTGHFLHRHVLLPRRLVMPPQRERLLRALRETAAPDAAGSAP